MADPAVAILAGEYPQNRLYLLGFDRVVAADYPRSVRMKRFTHEVH